MIYSYMDLSTGHIKESTDNWLTNQDLDDFSETRLSVYPKRYGYFILVPDDHIEDLENVPDDLKAVLKYAQLKKCMWVHLDRDGEYTDVLPKYDW